MADHYTIVVIRHLPTAGNQQKRYIGWTDEPLMDRLKRVSCRMPVSYLCGSDLVRSRQTAALYFPDTDYVADSRWRECNFGTFEGKTYVDLQKDENYRNWLDDPYTIAPPEGERLQGVEQRVISALYDLPNAAVVVTHGGPIRVLLSAFSAENKGFWSWDVPHGEGYRLEWTDKQAFKEGKACTSISAVPIMAKENL